MAKTLLTVLVLVASAAPLADAAQTSTERLLRLVEEANQNVYAAQHLLGNVFDTESLDALALTEGLAHVEPPPTAFINAASAFAQASTHECIVHGNHFVELRTILFGDSDASSIPAGILTPEDSTAQRAFHAADPTPSKMYSSFAEGTSAITSCRSPYYDWSSSRVSWALSNFCDIVSLLSKGEVTLDTKVPKGMEPSGFACQSGGQEQTLEEWLTTHTDWFSKPVIDATLDIARRAAKREAEVQL